MANYLHNIYDSFREAIMDDDCFKGRSLQLFRPDQQECRHKCCQV